MGGLGLVSFIKGLLGFQKVGEVVDSSSDGQTNFDTVTSSSSDDHAYVRGSIESRGPCPGLNSLANQGWMYVAIHSLLFCKTDTFL